MDSGIEEPEEDKITQPTYQFQEKRKPAGSNSVLIPDIKPHKNSKYQKSKNSKEKMKKLTVDSNRMDDTGYETLQLEEDTFLNRINLIKQQLESEDHPLNQFISCFDHEFSDYYMIFLSSGGQQECKCIAK